MTDLKIGIMGGTFDPPHLGHIVPIEIAATEFGLDCVWYVPALIPPHKRHQDRTNAFHRTAMLALALKNYPGFRISTIEVERDEISYTVNTILELKMRAGDGHRLFFIMGSDSFLELHTWYAPAQLLQLCEIIIISRGADRNALMSNLEQLEISLQLNLKNRIHFSSSPHLPFSSTEIRKLVQDGRRVSEMLHPEVESYLFKHSLYRR